MTWLWIALGGALGTALRHALSVLVLALGTPSWPWGTFAVNVLGSFGLGVLFEAGEGRAVLGVDARLLLGTGVMGGFTTYSTFNLEALRLVQADQWGRAALYVGATLVLCFAAGVAGVLLGRIVRAP